MTTKDNRTKTKKRRIISLFTAMCMVVSMIPGMAFSETEEAGRDTVYTQFTSGNTVSRGTGTVSDPYNLFKDALAAVKPGGTIYIIDTGFINGDEHGKLPFIIDKSVNITSYDAANPALLDVRGSGIVLGGNVAFENIELSFSSKCHDAIFANGYELTLTNIRYSPGTRTIDLFAGRLNYLEGDASYWEDEKVVLPAPGEKGVITVSVDKNYVGTENSVFGNIYGGSMNEAWNGSAEINLIAKDGSKKLNTGDIYACGALESDSGNPFDTNYEPNPPTPSADYFPTAGDVEIRLSDQNVMLIDGETGSAGSTSVDYKDAKGYLNNYTVLRAVSGISVKGIANLKPAEESSFNGSANISIAEGATLDLGNLDEFISVKNFSGGGTLILSQVQTMSIEETVSGSTTVGIGSLSYDGKSEKAPVEDHTYITVNSLDTSVNENTFIFAEYTAQMGLAPKFNPYEKSWITAYEAYEPIVNSFTITTSEGGVIKKSYTEFNQSEAAYTIEVDLGTGEDPGKVNEIPFTYFVKDLADNSTTYEAKYGKDGNGYYGKVEPLNMAIAVVAENDTWEFWIQKDWDTEMHVPAGEYEITVAYEGTESQTVKLVITPDEIEESYIDRLASFEGVPKTLENYYIQASDVIDLLPKIVEAYLNNGERVKLDVSWRCDSYDAEAGVKNSFRWTADKGNYNIIDEGLLEGEVEITNKPPIPVTITGNDGVITYGDEADVSKLFNIDANAGEASYEIVDGGNGKGVLDGSKLSVEKVGTFKIKMMTAAIGNYAAGSSEAILTVSPANISSFQDKVALSETSYIHDGNAKKPTVSVTGLHENTDYTVIYQDSEGKEINSPIESGTYTVVITGQGNYTGILTKEFVIKQADSGSGSEGSDGGDVSGGTGSGGGDISGGGDVSGGGGGGAAGGGGGAGSTEEPVVPEEPEEDQTEPEEPVVPQEPEEDQTESEEPVVPEEPEEDQTEPEEPVVPDGSDDDSVSPDQPVEPSEPEIPEEEKVGPVTEKKQVSKKENNVVIVVDTNENATAKIRNVKKTKQKTIKVASELTVKGYDYRVTAIGAKAFRNCTKATKIILPKSIVKIEKYTFTGAKNVKIIKFTGKKAPTIAKGAFKGLNTKKMTIQIVRSMPKAEYDKLVKAVKKAGFKGKFKRVK